MGFDTNLFKPGHYIDNANAYEAVYIDQSSGAYDQASFESEYSGNTQKTMTIQKYENGRYVNVGTQTVHFLPYAQNYNLYIRAGNNDVMSGLFSGCLMVKYRKADTTDDLVCHVFTKDDASDKKKEFFSNNKDSTFHCVYKPWDRASDSDRAIAAFGQRLPSGASLNMTGAGSLAILTSNNTCEKLIVIKTSDNKLCIISDPIDVSTQHAIPASLMI